MNDTLLEAFRTRVRLPPPPPFYYIFSLSVLFNSMKSLLESWNKFLNEEDRLDEPDPLVLNISDISDSGFCAYNPTINAYAQESPENIAEMLIFVIATQRQRWYEVVARFPMLMKYIKQNDGLLTGEEFQDFPQPIKSLILGFRKNAIDYIWRNRERLYSSMMSDINKYNNAKSGTIEKEEAMFSIYLKFLTVPGLGLPKAAFASQLIIGRLGCIDSINLNIYKGLDPEGKLIKTDKDGKVGFKTAGKKLDTSSNLYRITKGGVELAQKYVEFLKQIADMNSTTEANISKSLWDTWVEIVAKKINLDGDLEVVMPGGKRFKIPNDYSKKASKGDSDHAGKFRDKWMGKITGKDVSRQHHPEKMFEGLLKESSGTTIRKVLREAIKRGLFEVIRKKDGQYCLVAKTGRNLGCYDSKKGAEKREKQVNYFKHKEG